MTKQEMFGDAVWLTEKSAEEQRAFVLRAHFSIKNAKKATLRVLGLGIFHCYINGKRVGDALFAPGFTSYPNRLMVHTYNIASYLREGENTVDLLCANGWAVGFLGRGNTNHFFSDRISLLSEIMVDAGGTKTVIGTDDTWQVWTGERVEAELYHGETVDKTREETLVGMAKLDKKNVRVVPAEGVPVREQERLAPYKLIITPKGEKVIWSRI
jgi:alpha-L-rhamnosidase